MTARITRIAHIDATRCSGCGRCISACAPGLFAFETRAWKKTAVMHDADQCSGCGKCAAICIIGAISMEKQAAPINTCHAPEL